MTKTRLGHVLLLLCIGLLGSAHAAPRAEMKEWAFLIFLNGNNNLSEYGDLNLNQLEKIGSTKDIDVIVQWAKYENDMTYRLKIEKDNDTSKVTSPFLETMPRQDMGDYKNLVQFVKWSHERFPAKHYFIAFWNHGSGWHRNGQLTRGVSYDDYSNNHITTEQMGIAMREIASIIGHKVDIVGADACLMAMAEVGSEMVDSAEYFVASEETEPALGWPYDAFLSLWAATPTATPSQITGYLVDEYIKSMPGEDITLSSFHLASLPKLWAAMKLVSGSVLKTSDTQLLALKKATRPAISFAYEDYVDLGDWMKKAAVAQGGAVDPKLLQAISTQLGEMVVANKVAEKFEGAEGIAFWMPPDAATFEEYIDEYKTLRFHKETGWGAAVEALVNAPVCARHKQGQWAKSVIEFSSEYSSEGWGSKQATGACNTEEYGDKKTAWSPDSTSGDPEFIGVAFETPVYSTGAVIRESYGNGFVTKIEAIDVSGVSHVVWEGTDSSAIGEVVDFEVMWPRTEFLVRGLKIHVDNEVHSGTYKEIDSIQLVGEAALWL